MTWLASEALSIFILFYQSNQHYAVLVLRLLLHDLATQQKYYSSAQNTFQEAQRWELD